MKLTPELFEQYFNVSEDTLIMSPLASVCADSLGYEFTYSRQPDRLYQTVIVDQEGRDIPHITDFTNHLDDGGIFYGRFPKKYVMTLVKNKRNGEQVNFTDLNIKNVTFVNDYCIIKCVKEQYQKTVVTYGDRSERVIDLNKTPILATNNSNHYNYLESCGDSEYNRVNIRGSKNDLYKKIIDKNTSNCVFVGRLRPGCWAYDDVKTNVSYEMFDVGSVTKRDMFIDKLNQESVQELMYNLCYGEYIKVKSHHFRFIIHPNIFNL